MCTLVHIRLLSRVLLNPIAVRRTAASINLELETGATMLKLLTQSLMAVVFLTCAAAAQEAPQPSQPGKEHEWLKQLAGEWTTHGKADNGPGQPPFECDGTESTTTLGELWIVTRGEAHAAGMTVNSMLTLGYNSEKKKFVGTWVDSMFNHMWKYEGTLDESGKALTLMTEGPNMMKPGEMAKYKEVLELKDKDHKTFTSHMEVNGEWVKFMSVEATRVKK